MVMNLPDIKHITLICTQPMVAHWGDILIPGMEYIGEIFYKDTDIITDYVNYWKYHDLVIKGMEWHNKGYTENTLHEVIPGYMKSSDIIRLYTKRVEMPFISVKCSDTQTNSFCLLSDEEIFRFGADKRPKGRDMGRPCFRYSVHRVDDYFDYVSIRRDNVLNNVLNNL
jgi:hypothetical protein